MLTLFKERYEVLATVGSGGEAQIVKALDRQHGRLVALKIRAVRDRAAREDLLGEARILLALPPHPALPLVREDFFDRDDYIVAMDWVEGTDLATLLAENGRPGLPSSSVLAYLAQAAEALTHLHSQSPPVIHGDVKPGNMILTRGGRIKLVDFGLSSAPNLPRVRAGTPGYRAPELAAGDVPSRASDVYALAATAFALLTGSAPAGALPAWNGFDPAQAEQLEAAIRRGMATDPSRRPRTPGELVERLRAGWSEALPTGVVTFCCSEIEGSAALWESGPEAMAESLVRHDELIADAVEARGGRLIKSMGEGDATVSVFDSAPAAVAAALAANRALTAEEWPPGIRIAARWGIHTGEAERRDAEYHGPTVNLAALVRAKADAGEILLSSVTCELVAAHLPDGCSLVDLGPHRLEGLAATERIHALAGPGVRAPLSVAECPYRGLLAFEPGDRDFFFGRDEVTAKTIGRLAPGKLLAVVGASGSGKSSVLRAGVVAAVRAGEVDGLRHASLLTPGSAPALDAGDEPDRLVVVDQFEELFTLCDDPPRRRAFVDTLLHRRGAVAIGVRADIYGRLSEHEELALAVADNQVLLGPMGAGELERAITEPARLGGLKLEAGLVELILRDVAAEPGALPLLSHALRATWERRDGRTLTVEGYRETGGVASALARTADAVVDGLPAEQRALARGVFLRLTELGEGSEDSRRHATVDELVPEDVPPDTVRALLGRLADARLVTLDDGAADVAHEAIIRAWPRLRGWLDEDRAAIRAHRRLSDAARIWHAGGRESSDLYRGARLAGAVELAQSGRAGLNATERAFLDASLTESDRERRAEQKVNRRLRTLLAAGAVLLVVAIAGAALSLISRSTARSAESAAEAQALTSDAERVGALAQTEKDLGLSMLYSVAAVELQDRVQTRGQLLAVLQRNPGLLLTRRLSAVEVAAADISPDGRLLASGDRDGVVRFTDLRTWEPSGPSLRLGRPVLEQAMQFAPDGRTVAVGSGRGDRTDVHVVDVATRQARRLRSWGGPVTELDIPSLLLAHAPGGRHLAVTLARLSEFGEITSQRLTLLDARSGRPVWERALPIPRGVWEAHVRFTRDGVLITSAAQGETIVWDARRGRILRRFAIGGSFAISPGGERVAIALNGGFAGDPRTAIGLLNLRTGKARTLKDNLPNTMSDGVAFNRDGTRIIGGTFEGTHVWDVKTGTMLETFNAPRRRIRHGVLIDPEGRALLGNGDGIVSLWDPDGGPRLGRRFSWGPVENGCPTNPCSVIDQRGALMATTQGDGTTALIDLRTKRLARTLPARDGEFATGLSFSSDGRRLATGGTAGSVTIWDPASGAVVDRQRYADPVAWTALSPDGKLLAAQQQAEGAGDSFVEVRELPSGRALFSRRVGRGAAGGLQFSHDSRALFALGCCQRGSTVIAWDARSGAERFERRPSAEAWTFALAPDSRTLFVGTGAGSVLTLDARTGREREPAIDVTSADMAQIALSPDGRLLAASDWSGEATLWDLRTHERVGDHFPKIPGLTPQVAFEPNGRLLLTEGGAASEWPVDRPTLQRFACRVAGRSLSRDDWRAVLPNQPYRRVCG